MPVRRLSEKHCFHYDVSPEAAQKGLKKEHHKILGKSRYLCLCQKADIIVWVVKCVFHNNS